MTKSTFSLPLSILVVALSSLLVSGQEQARPRVTLSDQQKPVPQQPEAFQTNYRVSFSGKSDDKSLGELSTLTCAREISITGPLNSSSPPTIFAVSGTLDEKDGFLIFTYTIGFRVPTVLAQSPAQPQPQPTRVEYQEHSSKGALRMKPGKVYELLKAGGNIYSIVVAPEIDE